MSDIMRITGLSSGMDTDTMVKDLMKAESLRKDKVEKERKTYEYTQESYREIIEDIRGDFLGYFDYLNPDKNIRSQTAFAQFTSSVTKAGEDSSAVSVSVGSAISNFSHEITEIKQLATNDTWSGTKTDIKGIKTSGLSIADLKTALGTDDFKVSMTISGVTKTVEIANNDINVLLDDNVSGFAALLNNAIGSEFGTDYANVVQTLDTNADGNPNEIEFDMIGNNIKILAISGNEESVTGMTLESGVSAMDYASKSIGELFDLTGIDLSQLSVNGNDKLGITEDMKVSQLISVLNGSQVGVNLSFNSLDEKFTMKSSSQGSAHDIDLDDQNTIDFFAKLGITDANRESGKNAILTLDGNEIIQSTNTFTADGVSYTLRDTLDVTDNPIEISVTKDVDSIVDNIVKFVDTYNKLIEKVNGKLSEKRYYDYKPMTDAEISDVSEDEAELWKEKASSGLLRNSTELSSMVTNMRMALYESVENVGVTLDQIGITSTNDYKAQGQLTIDEEKLRDALENNYSDVVSLFTNESDYKYLDGDNRSERYKQNGIANRLYDIIQDNVRTTRDNDGQKGLLIEKAGLVGDATQYDNFLQDRIDEYNDRLDDLIDMLSDKEESYYNMFAKMESALSEMQAQSQSFLSQLGSN